MKRAATKGRSKSKARAAASDVIRNAFFEMEPELRQIEGVLTLLSILGEAGEPVEPVALATLAHSGHTAFEQFAAQWRSGFQAAKEFGKIGHD